MGKILYFRCVIRGGQSPLFVSLWTVSFWQFNNRFGRRIKAEKATVTMLSFPYSWSRTTHAILLGQKQSFNGFALSQIYYRYICFPTTLKPVGIKALEGIPFPYQKYYGSNMFLPCLSPFTEIIFTVTFLIMMVTIDVKNNSGSFEWILEWDCQADLWLQRFFTYERLTNLNTFLPHNIMNNWKNTSI